MWTTEQRQRHDRAGLRYPSDLSDGEWALVEQWEQQRNAVVTRVDWQFTTAQARIKLRSLYPSLHT